MENKNVKALLQRVDKKNVENQNYLEEGIEEKMRSKVIWRGLSKESILEMIQIHDMIRIEKREDVQQAHHRDRVGGYEALEQNKNIRK